MAECEILSIWPSLLGDYLTISILKYSLKSMGFFQQQSVKMERENNLKAYKSANDLDLLPKYGAGSEYGRDLKEESRRKKYGIMLKRYVPEDQPWLLKIGAGKQTKK